MNAGPVRGGAGAAAAGERKASRTFGEQLDRARRSGRPIPRRPDALPAPDAARSAGALASPGATLQRRRLMADAHDDGLSLRRGDVDRAEQSQAQRPAPVDRPPPPSPAPGPATLAATVERLALDLRRREAAGGHSLEMRFGAALEVRLTQVGRALRIDMAGDRASARLARAEMPEILAALRARGLSVSRAEVREVPAPGPDGKRLVDGAGGLR